MAIARAQRPWRYPACALPPRPRIPKPRAVPAQLRLPRRGSGQNARVRLPV